MSYIGCHQSRKRYLGFPIGNCFGWRRCVEKRGCGVHFSCRVWGAWCVRPPATVLFNRSLQQYVHWSCKLHVEDGSDITVWTIKSTFKPLWMTLHVQAALLLGSPFKGPCHPGLLDHYTDGSFKAIFPAKVPKLHRVDEWILECNYNMQLLLVR